MLIAEMRLQRSVGITLLQLNALELETTTLELVGSSSQSMIPIGFINTVNKNVGIKIRE